MNSPCDRKRDGKWAATGVYRWFGIGVDRNPVENDSLDVSVLDMRRKVSLSKHFVQV
jgi:hypothetical protein